MLSNLQFQESEFGLIPIHWELPKLGNILYIKGRIGWKNLRKSDYTKEGYAIFTGKMFIGDKVDWMEAERIPKDRYDESPEIILKKNDILLTKDGTIGKVAFIYELKEPATIASHIFLIRSETDQLLQRYLFYFFISPYFQQLVETRIEGSVVPALYQRDIVDLRMPLPPIKEQNWIVKVLDKITRKIELNHQMNDTLEQLAQAIFKSWLVDFEPFRDPEHEWYVGEFEYNAELAKEIPKGWEVNTIGEIIDFNKRRSLAKKTKTIKVGMADIQEWKSQIENYSIEEFKGSGSKFENGDVLFARITPCLENGKTGIVNFLADDQIGFGSTEFIVLSPKEEINTAFIYSLTREENFRNNAINLMTGSSGRQRVDHKALSQWLFPLPNNIVVIQQYNKITKPFLQKMKLNNDQNKNLKALRDLLLPQLISGKLRIPDPEKFLEVIDT